MRPTYLTPATDLDRFVGAYGTTPRWGILSEHMETFTRAGGVHLPSPTDLAGWLLVPADAADGDTIAYPVVCSELVEVWTEDGRASGRCGHPALEATGTCPAHDRRSVYCSSHPDADHTGCPSSVECFHA